MRVLLSGFMAAGKTTVGRALAGLMEAPFVDLDQHIEERFSTSLAALIEEHGEEALRDLESAELATAVGPDPVVIALGGGAVLRLENRRLARRAGTLVWLDTDRSTILTRLSDSDSSRPLHRSRARTARLYEERLAVYQECDLRIRPRVDESAAQVAERVLDSL